ncbi:MAG: DNA translocase FtsK [Holosporales bacterium]
MNRKKCITKEDKEEYLFMKNALFSDQLDTWLGRMFTRLNGGIMLLAALFLMIAVLSYCAFDESFNAASSLPTKNILNWPGAYFADIFMQTFGYASFYFLICLGSFSALCLLSDQKRSFSRFFSFSFLSTFSLGCFLNLSFYCHGGVFAYLLSRSLSASTHGYKLILINMIVALLCLVCFIFFGIKSFNKSLNDLKKVGWIVQDLFYKGKQFILVTMNRGKKMAQEPLYPSLSDLVQAQQEPTIKSKPTSDMIKQKTKKTENRFDHLEDSSFEEFHLPPPDLLDTVKVIKDTGPSTKELNENGQLLQTVLEEFGVRGEIVNIRPGPVVTMYELKPAPGIKTSRVISLADDIARSMSALSARIAVIPGQNVIGIELPNKNRITVFMKDLLLSERYQKTTASLPLILGKDIGGEPIIADLTRMPHLLVAGTTGSGKSVSVNAMILSILFKLPPEKCRFIMVDPKMLELSIYDDIPHLLTPVVTDPKKAVVALKWAVKEMENRYQAMSKLGVRNIDGYNVRVEEAKRSGEMLSKRVQTGFDPDSGKPIFETQNYNFEPLPYIIVVVDEMADLMLVAGKEIEAAVQRLAQMARAAGIHLIMATQRPSVDVITGTIKANFPTRISFMVTSKIDSRTILGEQGAEQLLGQGDMLYMAGGGRIQRVHGPFMKDVEVERVVGFLQEQGEPTYIEQVIQDTDDDALLQDDDSDQDPVYKKAVDLIRREGKVSTSFIQRHLSIGYNRAARIVDQMEAEGIVSPANHTGKREIIG